MAERELERAQKALRQSSDYYGEDDDDDDSSAGGGWMVKEEKKTTTIEGEDEDDDDGDDRNFDRNDDSNRSIGSCSDSNSLLFDHPFSEIPLNDNNSKTSGRGTDEEAIIEFLPSPTIEGQANVQETNSLTAGAAAAGRGGRGGGGTTNNISSFDPLVNQAPKPLREQIQSQTPTVVSSIRNLASRIPAPNSLFDDDDSTSESVVMVVGAPSNSNEDGTVGVELSEFGLLSDGTTTTTQEPSTTPTTTTTTTRISSSTVPGVAGFLEMEEEPPRDVTGFNENEDGRGTRTGLIIEAEEEDRNYYLQQQQQLQNQIRTDSGLVLTHRKLSSSSQQQNQHPYHPHQQNSRPSSARPFSLHPQHQPSSLPSHNGASSFAPLGDGGGGFRGLQHDYFEEQTKNGHHRRSLNNDSLFSGFVEGLVGLRDAYIGGGAGAGGLSESDGKHSMAMLQARRLLSLVRVWIVIGAVFVLVTTGAFFHSLGHKELEGDVVNKSQSSSNNQEQYQGLNDVYSNSNGIQVSPPQEILLLPLDDISKLSSQRSMEANTQQQHEYHQHHHGRRLLSDLRQEFEAWVVQHNKSYQSVEEKEHRFSIWTDNHWRTHEKNIRHGPCRLTKQHVFGSNHFKDLSPDEFRTKYLTGYKGMRTDELDKHMKTLPPSLRKLRKDNGLVMNPNIHKVNMHESVRERHLKYHPQAGPVFAASSTVSYGASSPNCDWYDVSCYLRWVWYTYGTSLGGLIGTMEPAYDSSSYPNAVDWRDSGAVTNVRTQGSCGACWAITAVETIESAHYISTGQLYDLSETEIIACDDSCEMCSGGWPQNAYSWTMKYGGLPLSNSLGYNADTLLSMTYAMEGGDDETKEYLRSGMCPAGSSNENSHDSNDENTYWEANVENENYGDYTDKGRYGNIKGYGYATDRCLCYTDGSGCDCDDQDEDLAVRNLATYGPAVVCIEASLWQDYSGGIITTDLGCGQEFLDMNHCVQVVGYAFTTDSDRQQQEGQGDEDGDNDGGNDQQRSNDNKSGSNDESNQREGYWIVRNQWGTSWGMNGYAYVAMGANTCGILNDMTQAYL